MNRRFPAIPVAALIFALLITGTLYSEDLKVTYLEGRLVSQVGGYRTTLNINDSVHENATLELSENGYVELYFNSATMTLTGDGVYYVADLLTGETSERNFRDRLSQIASFFRARPNYDTVAATRAAKPEDCNEAIFEGDLHLNNGIDRMYRGNYDCAALHFSTGMTDPYTSEEEQRECAFRLGTCYLADGEARKARDYLTSLDPAPEPGDEVFGEYVITVSALYIESREYSNAEILLSQYLTQNPTGEIADAASYLMLLVS